MTLMSTAHAISQKDTSFHADETFTFNTSKNQPYRRYRLPKSQAADSIWIICSPIVLTIGTIGNVLSIVVLCRKGMKCSSVVYFINMSIADLSFLYVGLLRQFILKLTGFDFRHICSACCKTHVSLVCFLKHFTAWSVVLVAVDRFVYVRFPLQAKRICTEKNALIGVVIAAVPLLAINSHFFWTHGRSIEYRKTSNVTSWNPCTFKSNHKYFNRKIWPWLDATLHSYLPFIFLLVCNVLIIIRLIRAHNQRKSQINPHRHARSTRMTQTTAMLFCVTFTFLILTSPTSLYSNGQRSWWMFQHFNNPNFRIFSAVASLLMYLNSALNFVLYVVSSPKFRKELTVLVCQKWKRRNSVMVSHERGIINIEPQHMDYNGQSTSVGLHHTKPQTKSVSWVTATGQ